MRYTIKTTEAFNAWLYKVRDRKAVRAITMRLTRVEAGHLGDVKTVGDSVSEMRIFVGKGYRIYYSMQGDEIVVLLCGGDKSSKKTTAR